MSLDPITTEVIHNYYLSAAREMERNLMRTAYTTIVYEIRDFGLGIYDKHCRVMAESPGLAIFTCGNDYGLKKSVEFIGVENLEPGDLILTSYPYWSSAHPLDVLALSPIFYKEKELIGFTAIKQHWIDLGQKEAGYMLDSTDVFQEGLLMPAMKLYRAGVRNEEIVNLIRFNSRIPDRVIGDMNAQISACRTGERRVAEMAERFGLDTLLEAIEAILDHGERISRARLAELPKGTWTAEDFVDDDGINRDQLLKLKCTVTITDDEFIVDWSGSEPTTQGPMNVPIGLTTGVSGLAFKGVTTPDYPANSGHYRPLKVIAPEGEIMHATSPAPTFTIWASLLAPEVVLKALSKGMPDHIPACSGGDIFDIMGLGIHPETGLHWLEATNEAVGFGGHSGGDGEDGIMHLSEPGCRNNPVEVLETKGPWIIENYNMRQDSGGPGQHRGGVGVTRTYRFLHHSQALAIVKKTKTAPWGMNGGKDGNPGSVTIWPGTDKERVNGSLHEKDLQPEDVIINSSGGGGGWGNPLRTETRKTSLSDVREMAMLSESSARENYGVDHQHRELDCRRGSHCGPARLKPLYTCTLQ